MKKTISFAIIIVLAVFALCACAQKETVETANCTECHGEYPKEYLISAFSKYKVCPSCAEKQISNYRNQPGNMSDYDEDYMVIKKSECTWCGNYAPTDLYDENGERICIDCITEALQDSNVARAVRNYFEYG